MRRGGSERGGRCESASSVSRDTVSSMRACQAQSEVAAQCQSFDTALACRRLMAGRKLNALSSTSSCTGSGGGIGTTMHYTRSSTWMQPRSECLRTGSCTQKVHASFPRNAETDIVLLRGVRTRNGQDGLEITDRRHLPRWTASTRTRQGCIGLGDMQKHPHHPQHMFKATPKCGLDGE